MHLSKLLEAKKRSTEKMKVTVSGVHTGLESTVPVPAAQQDALKICGALANINRVSCLEWGILVRALLCSHIAIIEATHPKVYIQNKKEQNVGRKGLIW